MFKEIIFHFRLDKIAVELHDDASITWVSNYRNVSIESTSVIILTKILKEITDQSNIPAMVKIQLYSVVFNFFLKKTLFCHVLLLR